MAFSLVPFSPGASNVTASAAQLATSNGSGVDQGPDVNFVHVDIDQTRWNQSFPFQLTLVKQSENGYVVNQDWNFTLPIGPSAISINMPFAIEGEVTLGGYHENNGGAPIRYISLTGTTGVLPLKGSAISQTLPINSIFGGTLNAINQNIAATNSFLTNVGVQQAATNVLTDDDLAGGISVGSGYYQFLLLRNWFENYAEFKRTSAGRDYRLAFSIWKEQSTYLVTPLAFNVPRDASSPYEYPFSLAFKAWKRIQLTNGSPNPQPVVPLMQDSNALQTVLGVITSARAIIDTSRNVLAAVGGDLENTVYTPIRNLSLFLKDAVASPIAFADLSYQLVTASQDAIVAAVTSLEASDAISQSFRGADPTVMNQIMAIAALGSQVSQAETNTGTLANNISTLGYTNYNAQNAANQAAANPVNKYFQSPQDNYALFSQFTTAQVSLPPVIGRAVQAQRLAIRQTSRLDFENQRNALVQFTSDFADFIGAGNATYSQTYHTNPVVTTHVPTDQEFQILYALNDVIMQLNALTASGATNRFQISSMAYMAGLATRSGIAFQVPQSKFQVPFPYGYTLEKLSQIYLGDPGRWMEIATLNGLREPFVDEVGFDLPLLTNGRGNEVQVSDISHLCIGQMVWISSNNLPTTICSITNIRAITSGLYVITTDAASPLDNYSTLAGALLHAFRPDTVNSMQSIYIPSQALPQDTDYQAIAIPGVDASDPLIQAGGVDFLLTDTGDIVFTPDGDTRLAIGLQNIIQQAKIAVSVVQGTLSLHQTFGLPVQVGQSLADTNAQNILKATKNLFTGNSTFTGVKSASVRVQGPATLISMQLGIAGVSQYVPVTFSLRKTS